MRLSKEEIMAKKLYVGGLPYSVTDDKLRSLLEPHGTVESASVVMDKMTDRSRGFGFVEMGTQEQAEKAISALNGTQVEGRTLTVNLAKPREDRGGGGSRGGGRDRW
jgi:RNA recognition motif-containing protein